MVNTNLKSLVLETIFGPRSIKLCYKVRPYYFQNKNCYHRGYQCTVSFSVRSLNICFVLRLGRSSPYFVNYNNLDLLSYFIE